MLLFKNTASWQWNLLNPLNPQQPNEKTTELDGWCVCMDNVTLWSLHGISFPVFTWIKGSWKASLMWTLTNLSDWPVLASLKLPCAACNPLCYGTSSGYWEMFFYWSWSFLWERQNFYRGTKSLGKMLLQNWALLFSCACLGRVFCFGLCSFDGF